MIIIIIIKKKVSGSFFKTDGECKTHHPHLTETCGQSGKTKGRLTFTIKSKHLRNEPQSLAMADTNRNSAAAAATGVVGGLASDPHLLGDDLNNMYSDIIDKEEEDMGGAKNLMALSNKKQGTNQKKSTKHPKPPTRGKGKFEFFF